MDLNIFIAVLLYSGYASGIVLETHQNEALSISVPASMPTADIEPISRDFAAFAFEERSFYYYFGTPNKPNTFSKNLLNAITAKTNAAPNVRVGGSSLDDSQYNPSQPDPIKIPPGEENAGIPNNMTFGPSYFDAFATIPNAKYVVDIPMKKNKLANSKAFAKAAYNKIGADNIVGLEIGNEPDNYGLSKQVYVDRWKKWSAQMMQTLDLGEQKKIFQAVCLASQTGKTGSPGAPGGWRVPELFDLGLKDVKSRIGTVSMHYYQTKVRTGSDLQRDIMNHTAVVHGSSFVKDAVVFLNNLDLPIPLALAEVGSVLGGANASQNNALAAVFGSALWQVDFSLYSMSIGVQRINWQSGLGFPFALWNPQYEHNGKTVPASVHPAFYGHIFVGEFVGKTGNTRVKHLELGKPFLAGYAAYDAGKLARIAFVNLELWSEGDGERLEKKITLDVGVGVSEVSIKRLTSKMGGTARVGNITWGGVQWTVGNGGKEVEVLNDTTTVPVNRGMVEIGIKPSEAVMIQLSG